MLIHQVLFSVTNHSFSNTTDGKFPLTGPARKISCLPPIKHIIANWLCRLPYPKWLIMLRVLFCFTDYWLLRLLRIPFKVRWKSIRQRMHFWVLISEFATRFILNGQSLLFRRFLLPCLNEKKTNFPTGIKIYQYNHIANLITNEKAHMQWGTLVGSQP